MCVIQQSLAAVIGRIPYRLALAGGWIDQPFVSRLNPQPPGSMVVVGLEPVFRFMDRSGLATGTRAVATKLWRGKLPARPPAELTRELYEVENRGKAEPSGSQDMIGLIYPGISRLDYDFAANGGVFPAHIESLTDAGSARWLERVIQMLPVAPRPEGYNPLGQKRLEREVGGAAGADGKGLLRGDPAPGSGGAGRVAERVHGLLGETAAAYRAASDVAGGSVGPAAGIPGVLSGGDVLGLRRRLPVGGVRGTGAGRVSGEGADQSRVMERTGRLCVGQGPLFTHESGNIQQPTSNIQHPMIGQMGPKQVVVTGAFDDLRSGQIRFLEEAAKLGEVTALLWGDELVRECEGRGPKFPEAERAYFLQAIRFVRRVVVTSGECRVTSGGERTPKSEVRSPKCEVDMGSVLAVGG